MFKNALISVSDKTGLIDFLRPIKGLRILSTGGTAKYLRENGFTVIDVSEQTGFPEVMDGRVKTLHPKIHMGLLARSYIDADEQVLKQFEVEKFDLVICNLYPFEQAFHSGKKDKELIEFIDIGGPSMLRSAAKSFERLAVLADPKDYSWIQEKSYKLSTEDRQYLAAKVFSHTSCYDQLIAKALCPSDKKLERQSLAYEQVQELRYGENPHQTASWLRDLSAAEGWQNAKIIQGKALSYNNLLDLEAAVQLLRRFTDPACVAVKHNNPCGVACSSNADEAVKLAISADPVSVFGGIIAINSQVTAQMAHELSALFLECIVAPSYSAEALKVFAEKKNLRILQWEAVCKATPAVEVRSISGGVLLQQTDAVLSDPKQWTVIGEQPSLEMQKDLLFAENVCASLKSNAICIVQNQQTLGLGMGQVNRVDAVAQSIERMNKFAAQKNNAVLASDAFFPFPDSIEHIAKAGIRWVIQPGGSVKDEQVIAKAKELKINMVLTGIRHFRH